jgi:CheY-like chemotaxis protein
MMGGDIGVDSEPGKGSTFWFTVDCRKSASLWTDDLPEMSSSENASLARAAQPLKILLAEDNQINQEIAVASLADGGHLVDVAENGAEAVQAVQSAPYDVVLMDIHMPVMDSVAATREIRQLPGEVANIPIIALTANAMVGDREKYMSQGMNGYASKPFDTERLLVTIRNCIANVSAGAGERIARSPEIESKGPPTAGLDSKVVEPLRVGKPDLWKRLAGIYISTAAESIDALEQALTKGDPVSVKITAHTLFSSSANMGAIKLSDLCRQLETAAGEGNLESGFTLLAEIRSEYATVSVELARDLEADPSAGRSTA